jgi:hypothetical protein
MGKNNKQKTIGRKEKIMIQGEHELKRARKQQPEEKREQVKL